MHDESAANDWLFFYVLSGRYDAITIRNAVGEVPLCVSHIRDAIYARISKVLKHMDVIQIRLIDPITEHEFFVGAPIEHLLFKWDESYEKAGGKPRPRIGSQQRPLKVIVDEELAKIWEGAMKREEDEALCTVNQFPPATLSTDMTPRWTRPPYHIESIQNPATDHQAIHRPAAQPTEDPTIFEGDTVATFELKNQPHSVIPTREQERKQVIHDNNSYEVKLMIASSTASASSSTASASSSTASASSSTASASSSTASASSSTASAPSTQNSVHPCSLTPLSRSPSPLAIRRIKSNDAPSIKTIIPIRDSVTSIPDKRKASPECMELPSGPDPKSASPKTRKVPSQVSHSVPTKPRMKKATQLLTPNPTSSTPESESELPSRPPQRDAARRCDRLMKGLPKTKYGRKKGRGKFKDERTTEI